MDEDEEWGGGLWEFERRFFYCFSPLGKFHSNAFAGKADVRKEIRSMGDCVIVNVEHDVIQTKKLFLFNMFYFCGCLRKAICNATGRVGVFPWIESLVPKD